MSYPAVRSEVDGIAWIMNFDLITIVEPQAAVLVEGMSDWIGSRCPESSARPRRAGPFIVGIHRPHGRQTQGLPRARRRVTSGKTKPSRLGPDGSPGSKRGYVNVATGCRRRRHAKRASVASAGPLDGVRAQAADRVHAECAGVPAIAVMHLSGEHGLYRRAGREHDGQAGLCDDAPHHPLTG